MRNHSPLTWSFHSAALKQLRKCRSLHRRWPGSRFQHTSFPPPRPPLSTFPTPPINPSLPIDKHRSFTRRRRELRPAASPSPTPAEGRALPVPFPLPAPC